MKQKLILIGSGMVGARFIERLLIESPNQFDIRVFNKEPMGGYNRIMLSPVLAGEKTLPEIMTHDFNWFEERGVHLHAGTTVVGVDTLNKTIKTDLGASYEYDQLVIATGSNPFVIPVPGAELPGVVTFRDTRDVDLMLEASNRHPKAVVIGGGLLGLEAANGLKVRGMDVTVVHRSDVLMNVQMDEVSGGLLKTALEKQGLKFEMNANTVAIEGEDRATGVRLSDGRVLPADLVVMAVGIRPNKTVGEKIGLNVNRGIVVNDQLQTSDDAIYALGECAEHRGSTYGLVAPLYEQAQVLAQVLSGNDSAYSGSLTSTMLKVTGIQLFSAGEFSDSHETDSIVYQDLSQNVYRKVVLKDNKIVGSVMFGDTSGAKWIFENLISGKDMGACRDFLVFGEGFCEQ
ncbi:MAG: FAD-dependent oxidoreductase [Pseudomonadota bacterium]|nr:FAD-dependent oxidoreductase [Pseudomonadota bacterium]